MSKVKKIGFSIALIFSTYVDFLDLLFLDKFITVLLVLLLLSLITLLLSVLNTFETKYNNLIFFNRQISNIAILLKL